jgi:hypothetical protein
LKINRQDDSNKKIDSKNFIRPASENGARNKAGMKLKKQISIDPVGTGEEEGATLGELNETGNAMQVLP